MTTAGRRKAFLCDRRGDRSDIYSLGVVLFELMTGSKPFQGTDAMALGMAILTERTPKASECNAEVPAALSAIVARAMARDPQDRYASAAELKQELSLFPAAASPATPGRRSRRRKAAAAAGIMILALLALIFYWFAMVSRPRHQRRAGRPL